MEKDPRHRSTMQRETLEWMGRQLASIRSEAIALAGKIRAGEGGDLDSEIAELEARLKSYRAKMEFEKRNAGVR